MLDNMKAFRMVVDCQGFRAAAIAMKLSPGMVSRRIERLECEVKAQLIKRNTRKVSLTAAGERFYQHCVTIIDKYESCLRDVKSLDTEISGSLKVGIPHSINNLHVIPQLNQFLHQYPNLRLEIVTGNHCMALFSHGFDLALQCGPLPDSNLYYSLPGFWRKHVCLSPEYSQNRGIPVHPEDLHNHTCFLHYDNYRCAWQFIIDDKPTEIRLNCPSRVSNSLDLYQVVRSGLGLSYLPDFTISKGLKSGEVISVLDEFMPPPLPMYMVYVNPQPSLKEQVFIDFIRSLHLTGDLEPAS